MEQKKLYVKPNVDVYEMKVHQPLLDASNNGSGEEGARVFEFTEPED